MKTKILTITLIALISVACSNRDWEFDDYDYTVCYFPFQTPARTLILGNYDVGINDGDNAYQFTISATMTGVYSNEENRLVYYEVDNTLLDSVTNVKALPQNYYDILTPSPVTIPPGSTKAAIKIQLNEDFFQDTLSSFDTINFTNYVVPVRIVDVNNLDSILTGVVKPVYADDFMLLNPEHWSVQPKDYTLFGIKYMNEYQANYLRRGVDKIIRDTVAIGRLYHEKYVVDDEAVFMETCGRNKVMLRNIIGNGDLSSTGSVELEVNFDDNGVASISEYKSNVYSLSGTGQFVEGGDTWGGKPRDVIYLNYNYTDTANNEKHEVFDTLVIRDRGAVFEEFELVVDGI